MSTNFSTYTLWSQYQRVKDDLPKTTNSLEGWHNALKGVVNVAHPSMSAFIAKILLEESAVAHTIKRVFAGHPTQQKRKKYQVVDARIKSVVDSYSSDKVLYIPFHFDHLK